MSLAKIIKEIFRVALFFLFSQSLNAQEHDALLRVLNSDINIQNKSLFIENFLNGLDSIPKSSELADCYHDLGSKWYYNIWNGNLNDSNLLRAIRMTEISLDIKRTLPNQRNCTINKTINNLAYFKKLAGHYYEAIALFKELDQFAGKYCKNLYSNESKLRWARQNLGELYMELGDYFKAIEIYHKLIEEYNKAIDKNEELRLGAKESYIQLAEIYLLIDPDLYFSKIIDFTNKATSLNDDYDQFYEHIVARIDNIKSNMYLYSEKYDKAADYYNLVLLKLTERDSADKAIVYSNLGLSQCHLQNYAEAKLVLNKAISYNPKEANIYNNLGDVSLAMFDFNRAMDHYNKAIALEIADELVIPFNNLPTYQQLELSVNKTSLLNHLVTKANAWLTWYEHEPKQTHLEHALETFDLADQLVDLIRFESTEQQSKLYWREKGASLYSKAVEVCYLLDKPEQAFYFMERNKALLLLEDLGHEDAKRIAGLPMEAAQNEFKLRRQI
ncbi:MAG: tetratricopeptide repeat protein, partial [Flavobacteriaceae bacterium]